MITMPLLSWLNDHGHDSQLARVSPSRPSCLNRSQRLQINCSKYELGEARLSSARKRQALTKQAEIALCNLRGPAGR